jgi:hypothetical protein
MFFVANQHSRKLKDDEDRLTAEEWKKHTKKRREDDYVVARRGDHLMVSFECDLCVFRKVKERDPIAGNLKDDMTQMCIRRITLDAFWSRASSTVTGNAASVDECLKICGELGIVDPYRNPGPIPPGDLFGYATAISMVYSSLRAGKYASDHMQFESIRKFRKCNSNHIRATAPAHGDGFSIGDTDGKLAYKRIDQDPCGSLWFSRFFEGCSKRMGQDWRPDQAIDPGLLKAMLRQMELRIMRTEDSPSRHKLVVAAAYFMSCYVISLRGPEGQLLDLESIHEHWDRGGGKYTVFGLWGLVKGETEERVHLLPSVNVTSSGIEVRKWLNRALIVSKAVGRERGPMMRDARGHTISNSDLNVILHEFLEELWDMDPKLFPASIKSKDDIRKKFNVFRSFRRGSDTRAMNQDVSSDDSHCVNRWKAKVKAKNKQPSLAMHHKYADLTMLLGPFLRYTGKM